MEAWGSLVDCPSEQQFDGCLKKFEIACSPWPMVVDYVNQTWVIPHKERFLKVWTNKVMHLGSTTTNRYEIFKYIKLSDFMIECIKKIMCFFYWLCISYVGLSLLIGP